MVNKVKYERTAINEEISVPWRGIFAAFPAYASTLLVAYSALFAAASTIDAPLFGSTALMLATLGLLSNCIRSIGTSKRQQYFGQAASLSLTVLLPLYGLIIDPHRFFPPIVFELRDLHPLALMTWVCVITLTVTGRWGSNEYAPLSFVLLPSLSMVALSAPHNINIEVTIATLLIVILGTFLLAYETTVMRTSKLHDRAMFGERYLIGFHIHSGAQWSLVILTLSVMLAPIFLIIRMPIAPPNVRLPVLRRYLIASLEFTTFSRHMSLWGGPINLTPRKVFEIHGSFYPYWRAQIYDEYTGHGWQYNEDEPILAEHVDIGVYRFKVDKPPYARIMRAKVIPIDIHQPALLTPGLPLLLETKEPLFELRLSYGGVLRAYRIGFSLSPYVIVAAVNDPPIDLLLNAPASYEASERHDLLRYLQLPEIPERVIKLAWEITSDAKTPYEKAMRIVEHLRERCRYSLSPPHVPMDADAVDFFLFESMEGACDFFASALALMCRVLGIPSRVVTGFMSDEYDPEKRILTLRERDAHAWVEIYIPGCDWVVVDPTPARSRIPIWDVVAWWREARARIKWQVSQRLFSWLIIALLLIIAMPMLRQMLRMLISGLKRKHKSLGQRLTNSYNALVGELRRLGFHCEPHHTPIQIATMLQSHECNEPLRSILRSVSLHLHHLVVLAYSPVGYNETSIAKFEAASNRLIWRLRWQWLLALSRQLQRLPQVLKNLARRDSQRT